MMAGSRKVSLQLASSISLCFDKDKIKQVVLNLFHNAVQHTDSEKGHIVVSLQKVSGGIELSIKDNGSGISKEHLSHVFERFYRSDSSRTRKYGGAGLGLSITKSIVDLHGGTISIESSAGEGSTFYVWLPMNLS
jgi:two-component system, OmpR family, sensor kinase